MCTTLQFRAIGPQVSDSEILAAARGFGFSIEDNFIWHVESGHVESGEAAFCVGGYAAGGRFTCCCPLADDPDGLIHLRGFLEFLVPRCSGLYYAPYDICLEEEPVREISPAAVHGVYRPGAIAPWGRVGMPEQFTHGLAHLARAMRVAGVEAECIRCEEFRFRVPGLGIEVSGGDESELAREILADLTWLWAEYGAAANGDLSGDALELKQTVLALARAGVI